MLVCPKFWVLVMRLLNIQEVISGFLSSVGGHDVLDASQRK